jgi:hypothetical protein
LVALPLLRALDARDRQVVYDVLHALARLKAGENEYRGTVMAMAEIGGLWTDVWNDYQEGNAFDQERMRPLFEAFGKHVEGRLQRELGLDLATVLRDALGGKPAASSAGAHSAPADQAPQGASPGLDPPVAPPTDTAT